MLREHNLHASVSRGFTSSPPSTNVPIRIRKREKERKITAVCRSISTYFFGSSYYRIIELRFYARFFLQDVFKTALMSQNVNDISYAKWSCAPNFTSKTAYQLSKTLGHLLSIFEPIILQKIVPLLWLMTGNRPSNPVESRASGKTYFTI